MKYLTEERLLKLNRNFNDAEKRVAGMVLERLHQGYKEYGPLSLNDGRSHIREGLEEAIDMSIYLAIKLIEMMEADDEK